MPAECWAPGTQSGVFAAEPEGFSYIAVWGELNQEEVGYGASYRMIREAVSRAEARDLPTFLNINSGGGSVVGMTETVKAISSMTVPTVAFTDSMAASAAYALAIAADKVVCTPSSLVGSVGVRIRHVDLQKAADNEGWKVTEIGMGDLKTAGSPFRDLDEKVLEMYKASIETSYREFCEYVSARMPNVDKQVFSSDLYSGSEASELGLVHEIVWEEEEALYYLVDDNEKL